MSTLYQLGFKDDWITLFELEFKHHSEEIVVYELEFQFNYKRSLKIEDAIRSIYGLQSGRYDSLSNPIELLKLILANGFNLRSQSKDNLYTLNKCFYPIQFIARSPEHEIIIGDYYKTSTLIDLNEQFINYCHWQDQIIGVNGLSDYMNQRYLEAGCQIIAKDQENVHLILNP